MWVTMVGRLGADPVSILLPSRTPVVHVPLLCKNNKGEEAKLNLNAYGHVANHLEWRAKKGTLIAVTGYLVRTKDKVWNGGEHVFEHLNVKTFEVLE